MRRDHLGAYERDETMIPPQVPDASGQRKSIPASRLLHTFFATVGVLLVTLVLLEGAIRIWGYAQRHLYDPIYRPFDRSQDIPYIHKPNLLHAKARGLAIINTDSLGLRAKTSGAVYGVKQANEYRIAIVGDSVTFGEGVPQTEDTFAQVLEERLTEQWAGSVTVFNYGASAYSIKQMAAMLPSRMVDIQPDLVVMAIIPTDFNLSRTPTIDSRGYLNLIDQRKTFFPVDSPLRDLLRNVHLTYLLREIVFLSVAQASIEDRISESYGYLQQFRESALHRGIQYVIVLLPTWGQGWGSLPERLRRDDTAYLDLTILLEEFTREQYMASQFDAHPSAAVHRRIGEELTAFVRDSALKFRDRPRRDTLRVQRSP